MEVNDFVKIKNREDTYGVVLFPSQDRRVGPLKYKSLNVVMLEDGTKIACKDDDLETIEPIKEE